MKENLQLHLNPYTAGNALGKQEGFFGRDDIFRDVVRFLRNPQSNAVVLYGQRRIGKTSVLLQLERQIKSENAFIPIFFDLQDRAAKPLNEVLYELAQRIAVGTRQSLPNRANFDGSSDYFREEFLPHITKHSQNKGLVLLFDEFDVLDNSSTSQADKEFFPYLRSLMTGIQDVKFIFVIGRRPEDLSIETMSTLKGVSSIRVSRLSRIETDLIVRQSEASGSLLWPETMVEKIWEWTQGHAFFTQLLCSVIWEDRKPNTGGGPVSVEDSDVDVAVDKVMQQGANAFHWIWHGLPPAERVVMGAMAEASDIHDEMITQEKLIEILNNSGVRLIMRELELAPETLTNWELLRPDGQGYRFVVPLLRRWVANHYPLRRVKDELDRLDPLAETYYQLGQRHYSVDQIQEAEQHLRQAIRINPNHSKARSLLGRTLLETNRAEESVTVLEEAYNYDATYAKADYIRALLALALAEKNDGPLQVNNVAIYERILSIEPSQPVARERHRAHLMSEQLQIATEYEMSEAWDKAAVIYQELLHKFPEAIEIKVLQENLKGKIKLANNYELALNALKEAQTETAKRLLSSVVAQQPDYKDSVFYLLQATYYWDTQKLEYYRGQLLIHSVSTAANKEKPLQKDIQPSKKRATKRSTLDKVKALCISLFVWLLIGLLGYPASLWLLGVISVSISSTWHPMSGLVFCGWILVAAVCLLNCIVTMGVFEISESGTKRYFYALLALLLVGLPSFSICFWLLGPISVSTMPIDLSVISIRLILGCISILTVFLLSIFSAWVVVVSES